MINEEKYFENIASMKLLAKKEVGQNFLIDSSVCKAIIGKLDLQDGEKALEIGCGAGSLSYFLALSGNEVDLIDIDEGMLTKVTQDFEGISSIHPQYGNAVKWDYSSYDKIIGNLPYYITSLIIEKCLLGAKKATRMVFMVQKEAALRIMASQGSKDYSPLSILLALSGKTVRGLNVSRHAFAPEPHVDSTVMVIDIAREASMEEIEATYRLAESLFLQRRKTIWNNLKGLVHDEEKARSLLEETGIDPRTRPEAISPKQYLLLASALKRVQ